jgi:hypothetical protein
MTQIEFQSNTRLHPNAILKIAGLLLALTACHKTAQPSRIADIAPYLAVLWDRLRHRRLVRGGPASDVEDQPSIRDLNVSRRTPPVASAENAAAEDLLIQTSRSVDFGDGDEMCDGKPVARGHLMVLLLDLYAAH